MNLILRPGTIEDAEACGRIAYEAFKSIADQHNFPSTKPSIEAATSVIMVRLSHPGFSSIVAELDGRIVGSTFLDERSVIAGGGPLSVDPAFMNAAIGRQLCEAMVGRAAQRHFPGMRGVVNAWHYRALALYTKFGGTIRETLSVMQGQSLALKIPGYGVRPAREADVSACNRLCFRVHGHDRGGELVDAIREGGANVVERLGRITGYATGIGWYSHAVAETNDDLKALIGTATEFTGVGFLLPSRNGDLLRWCLNKGLRVVFQANLMTSGLYNWPVGAYMPSSTY
ncbi:GNAT family N-acetyltransferase [Desulfococcus multivorans]|uniref:GCN5-related N-acetyltransferase n=1 Tax=Desulfococcus multivorans DSM 2059 TaxID=1121405 RepID=S7TT88_DESML|nr:GNAT family N-acetyltransferase [Desulfococcus multivorans]AOY60455.1 GCN5-related N-acetyltransferase [Desulfococcus multivorans]AQV02548.1 GNAT family N-acetyltransferase [Desulfococcus multivorans]EPR40267.1 GCN5-related N-acetyltransferase [Desulfococcus multivorans DSM 2059]SJZ62105.1 Acetyltransferase (GNAT) family protein [Desulfococcus multivorans DSM 2059]